MHHPARGKPLPAHRVDGSITVHCIEARIKVVADRRTIAPAAGELVYLAGGVAHESHKRPRLGRRF